MINLVGKDLAIDLGSANTLVYKKNKGIIMNEASQLALDVKSGEVVAVGNKAQEMIGKAPENIAIVNPLEDGTISDFDFTKILIKYCLDQANKGLNIIQPRLVITAPSATSDIELRAIEDACIYSGAREVYIIESALASAIGAGFDVSKSEGRLIVNIGAGNTDISLVSLNGIVLSHSVKYAGNNFNRSIQSFIYDKYSIAVGDNTVRELKEKLASLDLSKENKSEEISGRDLLSGMPVIIDVFQSDIYEAIIKSIDKIGEGIRLVVEKTPPDLSMDILRNGIFLTGASSQIPGLDKYIGEKIGIKVEKSEYPVEDAVLGAGVVIDNLEDYKNIGK
ncbi:rod shape-determining protein [uncultured Helcococcus sp.]|uniref:rod shape-determining protein n=1 Tax=uncultured Helcococcus sp. TaxID=1072508 RepID=UPI00261298F8|nr:rod shape-determining protein [uncultured Helcococcus sp.]